MPLVARGKLIASLLAVAVAAMPCAAAASRKGDSHKNAPGKELAKLQLAASQGDADAELALGNAYHLGKDTAKNDRQAVQWWRKAAQQGNAVAQFLTGEACHEGRGTAKNDREAVKWWRKAAQQDNADAQNNLGYAYHNGIGVSKDNSEAVAWWRKAAAHGGADAQFSLGAAFYNGEGVPRDKVIAHMWFALASEQGSEAAGSLLAQVEKSMTQEQIDRAGHMADEWKQQHHALTYGNIR